MKNKVFIIPADSINNNVSRSFYFAKYMAEHNKVYLLRWTDPQSLLFEKHRVSKFSTLVCFMKSLFAKYKVQKTEIDNLYFVSASRLMFMVIYRVIGLRQAMMLSRWYNTRVLRSVLKRLLPDVVFYADGFDGQHFITGSWKSIADVQDDHDENNFRHSDYQKKFGELNFNKTDKNFAVSRMAARNLERYYNSTFEYLPNGVDVAGMMNVNEINLLNIKSEFGDKFIVSYIGGDAWVDKKFSKSLFEETWERDKDIFFIVIGNVPVVNYPNALYMGGLTRDQADQYYHISDLGIMLKSSQKSKFLKNSVPLKILQYGILGKRFISPEIGWLSEEKFKNVSVLSDYTPSNLVGAIIEMKDQTSAIEPDIKYRSYDWREIVNKVEAVYNK